LTNLSESVIFNRTERTIMSLEKYLNENFPGPFADSFLKEHFKSFGVNVSIENDLFLFKYDQIEANWNNPIVHMCRGAILQYTFGIGWQYISRPWNKFFNRHEGKSGYSTDEDFKKLAEQNVELIQKADGSAVQVYQYNGNWKASTLGSIDTMNVSDFDFTFADLFWKIFGEDTSQLIPGNTYMFELCTVYNRIVTEYENDCVFFLGTYSNVDGKYEPKISHDFSIGKKVPIKLPFVFSSWKELEEFVEKESLKTRYGKNPEGFVVYINNYPAFKCKNEKYLNLHGMFTGDTLFVRKNIVHLFFNNRLDDVENDMPAESKTFLDGLRKNYEYVYDKVYSTNYVVSKLKADRKEYALKVQEMCKNFSIEIFSGYFFGQFREETNFSEWLLKESKGIKNYERQLDFWKTV